LSIHTDTLAQPIATAGPLKWR